MHESRSFIATPPGEAIKEQLEDQEMDRRELAERTGLSEDDLDTLIKGDALLTPEIASRLAHALGVPADLWARLEGLYRGELERVKEENEKMN